MKMITLGKKFDGKYDFRETCFGICNRGSKLVVIKDKGQYSLIGGGIEKGETQSDCLQREFLEEIGCEIEIIEKLCTVDCFWLAAGKWPLESLAHFYIVNIKDSPKKQTLENNELFEIELDSAQTLLPLPYHKEGISQYIKSIKK